MQSPITHFHVLYFCTLGVSLYMFYKIKQVLYCFRSKDWPLLGGGLFRVSMYYASVL